MLVNVIKKVNLVTENIKLNNLVRSGFPLSKFHWKLKDQLATQRARGEWKQK